MRVTIQRVKEASCICHDQLVNSINKGLLLLVGFTDGDDMPKVAQMAKKIANLRVFEDENDKMNLAIKDVNGEILSISQFTLYADTKKGNRPSFVDSMAPESANTLYQAFNNMLNNDFGIVTKAGSFGNHMYLDIVCDGPVTINLEF